MKIPASSLRPFASLSPVLMKLGTAMVMGIATATPCLGAEQVKLRFGFFSRTLLVSSLVTFAEEGTVDRHLEPSLNQLDDETLVRLQVALTTSREEDPIAFSQKLHRVY
jgi:hypothetical protein